MTSIPFTTLPSTDVIALVLIFVCLCLLMSWLHSHTERRTKAEAYDVIEFIVSAKQAKDSADQPTPRFHVSVFWAPVVRLLTGGK